MAGARSCNGGGSWQDRANIATVGRPLQAARVCRMQIEMWNRCAVTMKGVPLTNVCVGLGDRCLPDSSAGVSFIPT